MNATNDTAANATNGPTGVESAAHDCFCRAFHHPQ